MDYLIEFIENKPSSATYNAWKKAPGDVARTLMSLGVEIYYFPSYKKNKFLSRYFKCLCYLFQVLFKVKNGDTVYIQEINGLVNLLCVIVKIKHANLSYILHDLNYYRLGNSWGNQHREKSILSKMDYIYVHTIAMKKVIKSLGVTAKMPVFHLFDYYSNEPMIDYDKMIGLKKVIAFAGNLEKSQFLWGLNKMDIPKEFLYRLYGVLTDEKRLTNEQITYEGRFLPDCTGKVNAGWGLLWDGNSIKSCTGSLGEYLKINSSHKLSLYLACGMPLIVWKESSLSSWLSEQGVCVCINNLMEIPSVIEAISDEAYLTLVNNARKIGQKLRNGMFLKEAILNKNKKE